MRRSRTITKVSEIDIHDLMAVRAIKSELLRLKWLAAATRFELAMHRHDRALRRALKYNPDQPRVPAGNPDGGQWTSGGGGGINDPRAISDVVSNNSSRSIQLAQNDLSQEYSVSLGEEEQRGGHTIREHVGKTDEELMVRMRERGRIGLFHEYVRQRQGTFESRESANDFVNRTLERNTVIVDQVASGKESSAFIKERFGYVTGREAYRPNPEANPILRNTYGVGVLIVHDPRAPRGYRVQTAYPRND